MDRLEARLHDVIEARIVIAAPPSEVFSFCATPPHGKAHSGRSDRRSDRPARRSPSNSGSHRTCLDGVILHMEAQGIFWIPRS